MSLIEEALRRVQGPPAPPQATPPRRTREEPAPPHSWPVGAAPEGPAAQPAGRPRSLIPLLTVVAVLAILLWAAGAVWLLRGSQPRATASPQAPSAAAPTPGEALPSMVLSGVVLGAGEPYAVIDGRIVGVGESIGEAVVAQIDRHVVTLRRADGGTLELRVSR